MIVVVVVAAVVVVVAAVFVPSSVAVVAAVVSVSSAVDVTDVDSSVLLIMRKRPNHLTRTFCFCYAPNLWRYPHLLHNSSTASLRENPSTR